MPARKIALPKGGYMVRTPSAVHAKHTSKKNAEAQVRLLNAVEHNPDFKMKLRRKKK
jgi:hypothetical protein